MHPKSKTSRFGQRLTLVFRVVISLLILLLLAAVCGGYFVTNSTVNLPHLSLDGIAIGGLTEAETAQKLKAEGWDRLNDVPLQVTLPLDISFHVDRRQAGASLNVEEAAREIFDLGHSGHWVDNLENYLTAAFSRDCAVYLPGPEWNESYLRTQISAACAHFREKLGDGEIYLDKKNARLTLTKGGGQVDLDENKILWEIENALSHNQETLEYTALEGTPVQPDFEAVYRDVAIETKDAYFSENFEVIPEVVGCTFEVEQAAELWKSAEFGQLVEIPLDVQEPAVKAEELEALLYRDRLCFMTTYFGGSTANRVNNIHLAAEKLNGVTVMPGQVFSYNDIIGQRTLEAGFLMAGAYADGEVVEEIGGGICQVSSTLYCAAMYAQMTTVTRTNHYFAVGYLSMGYDATVSWTWPDYRFRNDREYPVVIVTYADEYSITIEFWGTDTDGSHVSPYTTTWEVYDETYPNVLIGYGAITHRRILDWQDNLITTIDEPGGIYYLHDQDIDWPEEKRAADAAAAMGGLVLTN